MVSRLPSPTSSYLARPGEVWHAQFGSIAICVRLRQVEEEPKNAHAFLSSLTVLMNAYVLVGQCEYDAAVGYCAFFEEKMFPRDQKATRIPLHQAMRVDSEVRLMWQTAMRNEGTKLSDAIKASHAAMHAMMQPMGPPAQGFNQQQAHGTKRGAFTQPTQGSKFSRHDSFQEKRFWLFKHVSGRDYCFNWNAGSCTDPACTRVHECAAPGCKVANCTGARNHPEFKRPWPMPAKGKGKGGKRGW